MILTKSWLSDLEILEIGKNISKLHQSILKRKRLESKSSITERKQNTDNRKAATPNTIKQMLSQEDKMNQELQEKSRIEKKNNTTISQKPRRENQGRN